MGIDDYLYFFNGYLFMVSYKSALNMNNYFDWLTLEWLMTNLEWVGGGIILSLLILLFFPVILTIEFKRLSNNKD